MPEVWVSTSVEPEYQDSVDPSLIRRAASRSILTGLRNDARHPLRNLIANQRLVAMSILLTSDETIHRLNREYRCVDKPTDVLSFSPLDDADEFGRGRPGSSHPPPFPPQGANLEVPALHSAEIPLPLGDVVLSYPYLQRQARDLGHNTDKELAWLTIHGTLQLLGYHHATEEEAAEMEQLESEVLWELGFGGADAH